MDFLIRDENSKDEEAITTVTRAAFEHHPFSHQTEEFIIKALRDTGALGISLVAEMSGEIVGHIAFSRVALSAAGDNWYGLGPLSVLPRYQRQGIGKALVIEGLNRLKILKAAGCVLVGDPKYYERFGFNSYPELRHEGVPQEYVLGLSFQESRPRGNAFFHKAFSATE